MTSEHPRPVLTIVSNADAKFFPGLAVALASATAAATGRYDYQFLVLDGGLEPEKFSELQALLQKIASQKNIRADLELLAIDQTRLSSLPERRGSRMTYAKLVLPEALAYLDSIIYLDADVLCFKGIEEVMPPSCKDEWLLAGARDYFSVIEKDCPWIDQVPSDERKLPYVNCGVMWMNLRGLREIDFTTRSIAARASIGNARQGDQSVFNFICRGRSYILSDALNHRTSIGASRPLCEGNLDLNLHYIGSPKPWLGPPKTSNYLAHRLWHQAYQILFSETCLPADYPLDRSTILRKSLLYSIFNPSRASHYRCDLRSLKDPSRVLEQAANHWKSMTLATS